MNITHPLLATPPAEQATLRTGRGLRKGFAKLGGKVWRAFEAVGRARAQRHLLAFADRYEAQQPAISRELRAAARQGPLA